MGSRGTRGRAAFVGVSLVLAVLGFGAPPALATGAGDGKTTTTTSNGKQNKDSGPAVHNDTSPPLATLVPAPEPPDDGKKEHHDKREDATFDHPNSLTGDPVVQSQLG